MANFSVRESRWLTVCCLAILLQMSSTEAGKRKPGRAPRSPSSFLSNDYIDSKIELVPNRKMGRNFLNNAVAEVKLMYYISPTEYERTGGDTTKITEYYKLLTHNVNLYYEEWTSPKIIVRMCGIKIFKTIQETPLSAADVYEDCSSGALKRSVLSKLQQWISKQVISKLLPNCDGHVYFAPNFSGGIATLKGLCPTGSNDISNVMLVWDEIGTYKGAYVLAHELAHALGAPHDGDKNMEYAARCPYTDAYTMGGGGFNNNVNFGRWSDCSKQQIRLFLASEEGKCVFSRRSICRHPMFPSRQELVNWHNISYSEQCAISGSSAYRKPGDAWAERDGSVPCQLLWCQKVRGRYSPRGYFDYIYRRPGTTCAPGMYCRHIDKQCVAGRFVPTDFSKVGSF